MKTKTTISLSDPTPKWVNWIFRIEFVLNKALMFWLASTSLINQDNLKEWIIALTAIDLFVWGIGRFIGHKKEDYENI
jgi:hypothetical protein